MKKEIWEVKESASGKLQYNICGTIPGMKYKIAAVPFLYGETVSDITGDKLKQEAFKHANLIAAAPELATQLEKFINSCYTGCTKSELDALRKESEIVLNKDLNIQP